MFVILVYIFLIGDLHLKTGIWWICGFLWLLFTILGKTTFLICISTKSLNCDYQSLNILTWLTGCVNTEKKVDCFVFSLSTSKNLFISLQFQSSVYAGLSSLYPNEYNPDTDLENHSGKLAVLACLLHQVHTADTQEKTVVVSNHTKVGSNPGTQVINVCIIRIKMN